MYIHIYIYMYNIYIYNNIYIYIYIYIVLKSTSQLKPHLGKQGENPTSLGPRFTFSKFPDSSVNH